MLNEGWGPLSDIERFWNESGGNGIIGVNGVNFSSSAIRLVGIWVAIPIPIVMMEGLVISPCTPLIMMKRLLVPPCASLMRLISSTTVIGRGSGDWNTVGVAMGEHRRLRRPILRISVLIFIGEGPTLLIT